MINIDLNQEIKEINNILDKEIYVDDLPKRFDDKVLNCLGYVFFSILSTNSKMNDVEQNTSDFFSNLLLQMNKKLDYTIPSPAAISVNTDTMKVSFYVNPYFFFKYDMDMMVSIIKHELYHYIFNHIPQIVEYRLKNKKNDYDINIAMDCSVNQFIHNLENNPNYINLETFSKISGKDLSLIKARQSYIYYLSLLKDNDNESNNFVQHKEKAERILKGDNHSNDGKNNDNDYNSNNGDSISDSNKTKIQKEYGLGTYDNTKYNDVQTKLGEDIFKQIMNKAANQSSGLIPHTISKILNEINKKHVMSWKEILKQYVGSVPIPYRETIIRLNRRQPDRIDLKGRLSDYEVSLTVALDVSASISDNDLTQFIGELFSILKHIKRKRIRILQFDAKVQDVSIVTSEKDIRMIERKGRGGTRFSPIFEYLKKENAIRELLVVLTDGEAESTLSIKPVHYRTLWLTTRDIETFSLKEPYGIVTKFNIDKQ